MKYIKDRFYNARKPSPSLGAPVQDPFNQWRANCLFLRVVSAKVRQVFETTKFSEKFFRRSISICRKPVLSKLLISSVSEPLNQLRKRFDQPPSSPTSNHVSDTSDHPFFGVADAKLRQLFESTKFSEKFFFREPHPCVWHLLYIGVPRSHLRRHLLYIGVPRSLSRRHLLYIGVPRSHLRGHLLYIVSYPLGPETSTKKLTSSSLIVKTCSPLKALQTPPKTRSFELRVQR